jgi:hypothetical protein
MVGHKWLERYFGQRIGQIFWNLAIFTIILSGL